MNKKDIEIIKELFNYNLERNNILRINILIAIWFVSTLNFFILIFCANSFLGKIISGTLCLIVFGVGVIYGSIFLVKKQKELTKHRNKIRKLLKNE